MIVHTHPLVDKLYLNNADYFLPYLYNICISYFYQLNLIINLPDKL